MYTRTCTCVMILVHCVLVDVLCVRYNCSYMHSSRVAGNLYGLPGMLSHKVIPEMSNIKNMASAQREVYKLHLTIGEMAFNNH